MMLPGQVVAVLDAAFCLQRSCAFCTQSIFGATTQFTRCHREMCDNHRLDTRPLPAPTPDTPPFPLPAPGTTGPMD